MAWIRIDLHVHSIDSSYTGSKISEESDLDKLLILQKHNIKVASFADHDNFYLDSYIKRWKLIDDNKINILLLPGLEVNLKKYNGQIGQAIIVFDPKSNLESLHALTTKVFRHNNNKLTYKEVVNLFKEKEFNFMIFPHAGKAQDNMEWEDIEGSQVDGLDVTDFNSTNKKKILKQNNDIPVFYFSDTHTWRKYPQYGKFCSYVEVDDKSNFTFNEIKKNINAKKIDMDKII